jgi:3-oxoacyl-[acyl-carrier protein] reductase
LDKLLSGKTILITGGSSRLGQAFVRKALGEGGKVFLTYLTGEEDVASLLDLGAEGFQLDLADTPAMDEFVKKLKERTEGLDILIHNAALVRDHTIQNLSEEEWDLVLSVDLKAPYYLTKKLLPFLFRRPMSKIFMVTSRAALCGAFGAANYAAAKAGLIALAKSLAAELGKKNILVNAVNPGFMKSRMTEWLPPEVIQKNLDASSLNRFSDPDEVADFLVYLCSDQMTQVTGQIFHWESRC